MSKATVYLLSGANKGIGLALARQIAAREDVILFAGARSPASATDLLALQAEYPSKVHIIKLVSPDQADAEEVISKIKEVAGRLDVVIANAGMSNSYTASAEVSMQAMRDHFDVNVLGPLVLFQAAYPLLRASQVPKFIIISSSTGSIDVGAPVPLPTLPYGLSKCGVNYMAVKLWYEYPDMVVLPVHPGPVSTDIMEFAATKIEIPAESRKTMLTPEASATGVLRVVAEAKRWKDGPKLIGWNGVIVPW